MARSHQEAAAAQAEKEKKENPLGSDAPLLVSMNTWRSAICMKTKNFKRLAKSLEGSTLSGLHKKQARIKQTHIIAPIVEIGTSSLWVCRHHPGVQKGKDITEYDAIKKTFAHNAASTRGVTVISGVNDKTKKMTICESLLDGIAYGQLKGFPEDECIVSTAGYACQNLLTTARSRALRSRLR